MAGFDYLSCEICGCRIMYEPDADPDIKVVCMDCYLKAVTPLAPDYAEKTSAPQPSKGLPK